MYHLRSSGPLISCVLNAKGMVRYIYLTGHTTITMEISINFNQTHDT